MDIIEKSTAILLAMGAKPVMWLMIALSILSLAIILERGYFFYSIRDDLEVLARELAKSLRNNNYEEAKKRLEASPSAEAAVVVAGLAEADRGAASAEEAMAGATALQRMKLERRLVFLGTLGNNAPFIGLFGTVIGVIKAFAKLEEQNKLTANAANPANTEIMKSIAEALVATAVGLAVAIPAVAAFNFFQRLIKGTVTNTDALSRVLLAHLKGEEPESALANVHATHEVAAGRNAGPVASGRRSSSGSEAKREEKKTEASKEDAHKDEEGS